LVNGMALPMLAYFDPQSGPGGTRTFLQLVYDANPQTNLPMGTSQFIGVNDISTPYPVLFGTGVDAAGNTLASYTTTGMTDTQAVWPMNGLVGKTITAPATIGGTSNSVNTTATVLFNIGNTIILTAAGWSNSQPTDGSAYSIT